ncbi:MULTISPECIES: hypothetical protein [Protofrankia]|uniref:Uncharacterized protein n=2 Tax=Protofrankia TaxID=2994361 RepID=F8AVV3_9ACTN|nr:MULTISPECIES: hypothetical protein [Protofrankia]AEH08292.1 hypothetical protein FsymDg_0777 [Candidatus Protofrankia datiscae]KLL13090.1 hypothetical protein FrCorBMG51_00800 [Protofrankia coriariae]ONH38073.1 hypothetical protein BL254_01160 [Protofrankia sp. BMG5.30]
MPPAGQFLALEVSAGTSGFLVVLLLGLAAVALFVMMPRSLARMRGNVASGRFGAPTTDRDKPVDSQDPGSGIPPQHSPRSDQ